ncbi:hypothetical protein BJX63DRAFT_433205 [Aspergillus granulosus]|uniref:EXPERA domain-containing protein n=1 Tax=Aspergillus granulosus TaxID=176169 RepID=A0ABR4H8P6_9EURO
MAQSLWSRKRDLVYFGFFAIHIPIILCELFFTQVPEGFFPGSTCSIHSCRTWHGMVKGDSFFLQNLSLSSDLQPLVDAVPILPSAFDNNVSRQLRNYYITTFRDKFFDGPVPTWFTSFLYMELYYHLPLSAWALGALLRGAPPSSVEL